MRVLIAIQRKPILAVGIVVAMISGGTLGASVQPDLVGPGAVGPRLWTPFGGARADVEVSPDSGWAGYAGVLPDYVLGADRLRQGADHDPDPVVDEPVEAAPRWVVAEAPEDLRRYAVAAGDWDDATAPPLYPSVVGNAAYPSDSTSEPREGEAQALTLER